MKILIVEDEPKIRDGLVGVISKYTSHEIVGIAGDGLEGIEKYRELKPELVISDIKMPKMDGLAMLEQLLAMGEEVSAMLLTGYSDFEFARKALKLRVIEYILKPLDIEEFLSSLKMVEDRLKKNKVEKVSPEQLLWSCLSGTKAERKELLPALDEAFQVNKKIQSSLFLIRPGSLANETVTEMMECVRQVFDSLCMENYYVTTLPREPGFLVILTDTERNRHLRLVIETRVLPRLLEISGCACCFDTIMGMERVDEAVQWMQQIIGHAFSFPMGTVIDREMEAKIEYEDLPYPDYLEQTASREIHNGNEEKVIKAAEQFEAEVIEGRASPERIREYTIRFITGMIRAASGINCCFQKDGEAESIMGAMINSTSKMELSHLFYKAVLLITAEDEEEAPTENGIVLNAISYIRNHYAGEVSLSDVALACKVTPEYLSKLFCREVNVNFSTFLQNFRISEAKRMLSSGKYKVSEVAEAVGFHDNKYFVKVFKKICGVTPSEYKREMGNG